MDNAEWCPCGQRYTRRRVQVSMSTPGGSVLLDDVVQLACPACGSRAYPRAVLQLLEGQLRDTPSVIRLER